MYFSAHTYYTLNEPHTHLIVINCTIQSTRLHDLFYVQSVTANMSSANKLKNLS